MTALSPRPFAADFPGRFIFEQELGRGGMAVVYCALDRHPARYIAIRVLTSESLLEPV